MIRYEMTDIPPETQGKGLRAGTSIYIISYIHPKQRLNANSRYLSTDYVFRGQRAQTFSTQKRSMSLHRQ